ncbi:hypothetical protein PI125_g21477 [Phytophthora idaei]|nr:hypothetical protein PI125_g21477 [Phytophthora idaei]
MRNDHTKRVLGVGAVIQQPTIECVPMKAVRKRPDNSLSEFLNSSLPRARSTATHMPSYAYAARIKSGIDDVTVVTWASS